jgi:WD40 repeat protein
LKTNLVALIFLMLGLAPIGAFAADAPLWSWHEADTEIYSPSFSKNGDELAIVRKRHIPDFHEAEEISEAERKKRSAPIEKNERYADPEVVILKIGAKKATRIDWGWSPAFSPDSQQVVYAFQKKPISRLRVLAETQAGNDIRLFRRETKAISVLVTPTTGYLSDPIFAPDGKRVVYSLSDAINGAWGGNIGIGQITIDGTGNEILYPATKDFELYHLIDPKRFIGDRVFAFRSKPTSGGVYMADSYACELLDVGPPTKPVYTWPSAKGEDPMVFASNEEGEVIVYDRGWRKATAPPKSDEKSSAEEERPGIPSPDGRALCLAVGSGLEIREFQTRKVLKTIKVRGEIQGIKWSPDSRRLAVVTTRNREGRGEIFDHDEIAVYGL